MATSKELKDQEIDLSAGLRHGGGPAAAPVPAGAPTSAGQGEHSKPEEPRKRGRGRPRKHPAPDPSAPKRPRGRPKGYRKPKPQKHIYNNNNIGDIDKNMIKTNKGNQDDNLPTHHPEVVDTENKPELTQKLTWNECKFIELYLVQKYKIDKAMITAGYGNYSRNHRYILAKKIIEKHENATEDHRKIMRQMGYGEVKILELLIQSATKAKSEIVKLNARIHLSKMLGMQQELFEGQGGITFIFESGKPQPEPKPGQARPAAHQAGQGAPALPPPTMQITK